MDMNGLGDASGVDGLDQATRMAANFQDELARLAQAMSGTGREATTLSNGLGNSLRRAFEGVAFDGVRLSDALKGVAQSMAGSVFTAAMKPVQNALAGALPFANGGAFVQGRIMPFAKGGVVSAPTHFPMRGATGLMGEAGPEAIMPLSRGADGRLGVAASGGATRAVNITFNIQTPDVAGFQRSRGQLAAQISRAVALGERNA